MKPRTIEEAFRIAVIERDEYLHLYNDLLQERRVARRHITSLRGALRRALRELSELRALRQRTGGRPTKRPPALELRSRWIDLVLVAKSSLPAVAREEAYARLVRDLAREHRVTLRTARRWVREATKL